jgi:hypothetical protein
MNSAVATIMGMRNWRGGVGMIWYFLGGTGMTRIWVQFANLPHIARRDLRCGHSCYAFPPIMDATIAGIGAAPPPTLVLANAARRGA